MLARTARHLSAGTRRRGSAPGEPASRRLALAIGLIVALIVLSASIAAPAHAITVDGLIVDTGNHRVIEVTAEGAIVWQYGTTGVAGAGADQLSSPAGAQRLANGDTLIVDTGNHRVIAVRTSDYDPLKPGNGFTSGSIVWQYGTTGVPDTLVLPSCAQRLGNGDTLIVDGGQQRVIEVTAGGAVAWQYGTTAQPGTDEGFLNTPTTAQRLSNGHTVIADTGNQRVIEVGKIDIAATVDTVLWQYGTTAEPGTDTDHLTLPMSAQRLGNGDTVIADTGNQRVIEVNLSKVTVWSYGTPGIAGSGPGQLAGPRNALRLGNGDTLIADSGSQRVIEILSPGWIPWQYGVTNVAGTALGCLDDPHGATLVDAQPPAVQWVVPLDGAYVRTPLTPLTLKAEASDNSGVGVGMVEFYDNAVFLGYDKTAPFELGWTGVPPQPAIANGSHYLEVVAYDEAGNTSVAAATVHVDRVKPRLSAPYSLSGRRYTSVTLRFTVKDAWSPTARITFKVRRSNGAVAQSTSLGKRATGSLQSVKVKLTAPRGTYRYYLYAKDLAGNTQYRVASNQITVR